MLSHILSGTLPLSLSRSLALTAWLTAPHTISHCLARCLTCYLAHCPSLSHYPALFGSHCLAHTAGWLAAPEALSVCRRIPFNQFSDKWQPASGQHSIECADDASVCPTAAKLGSISRFELWAEEFNGQIDLEVLASPCVFSSLTLGV